MPVSRHHALLLLLLLVAASGCRPGKKDGASKEGASGDKPAATIRKERPFLTPVLVKTAERGEIRATISTTGSIVPIRSQAVRSEEAGRLFFERPWIEGDLVEQDQVIARIESPNLARELMLNRADVDLQRENLDIADRALRFRTEEFRSVQGLYSRGISAKKELDAAELELERSRNSRRQALINLEKAQTNLRETENRVERLVLRAPFAGVVVAPATLEGSGRFARGFGQESVTSHEGRQISASHLVCGVVDLSRVLMRCDVTSRDIGRIALGQQADVVIYATEDMTPTGQVERISANVNPDTRAFEVDILLENPGLALRPGMFGRGDVVVERRRDRIRLPKSALTRRNNLDVVFVAVGQPDTDYAVARMTPVELGLEGKDEVEITFGVQSGDRVVVRGFEVLQDSTPINPIDVDAPILPAAETPDPRGS
ncbi:MAG: efflux RND transporter periplasmic adaptor subunit [Candidatus Sumerlaeia bacterium]|nr:efflux RND transporter periplasmic adaptor subunit [Candidatus Sumerlaeia bacterium]